MNTIGWVFHFRWIENFLGCAFLVALALKHRKIQTALSRIEPIVEKYFSVLLSGLCIGFFAFASIAKFSQKSSLSLNGCDFWLFTDMLEQMKHGGFLITRFAPQGIGWVQHGVIHRSFTWALALPFAWIFGSVNSALLFEPWIFALSAAALAGLAREKWGSLGALAIASAFLLSSQVGRILMYDVHPEAAYPLCFFVWAWSLGLNGKREVRWLCLILATLAGIWIREDSILLFLPSAVWAIFTLNQKQRSAAIFSLILAIAAYQFNFFAFNRWASGAWGPHLWNGVSVRIPDNPPFLQGVPWNSFGALSIALEKTVARLGGGMGALQALAHFIFSRPWISLGALFPWVFMQPDFWIMALPLAASYALLKDAAPLGIYYSAPFLGIFWLAGTRTRPSTKHWIWMLLVSLLLGGGGIEWQTPSPAASDLKIQTSELAPCLQRISGQGLVATPLIGLVSLEKIWTERIPKEIENEKQIHFALFAPAFPRFENSRADLDRLSTYLSTNPLWERWNYDCQATTSATSDSVLLYVRK